MAKTSPEEVAAEMNVGAPMDIFLTCFYHPESIVFHVSACDRRTATKGRYCHLSMKPYKESNSVCCFALRI